MTSILSAKPEPRDVAHLLRYPEEGLQLNSWLSMRSMVKLTAPVVRPSSLLVILHYLLKNNITFMGCWSKDRMSSRGSVLAQYLPASGGRAPRGRIVHEN